MNLMSLNALNHMRIYRKVALKQDFIASIVVFLVAIPLCLGIALASGASPFSGILSGIIGGIVVGALSGSQVSVSGAAAGMAAVVLAAITELGDFNTFLLSLSIAGILQIVIGSMKAGFIGEYVPSNVVQGLLCAIGILLIIKQLPLAFTLSASLSELQDHLLDISEGFSAPPLQALLHHINLGATLISLFSFLILISSEKKNYAIFEKIPASIFVVFAGVLLNELFLITNSSLAQSLQHLVNIPEHQEWSEFLKQFQFPNWGAWTEPMVYYYALIITVVASLETLLNVKAGEKLDKKKRNCSKDKELVAQGAGNLLSGLLGGLPITSVIVRTSVNIQAGAKTKMSTIFHGFFLFFMVFFLPGLLNKISLSSLATILIFTGYKLTKPVIYKSIYNQGLDRFIPFIATVIGIVIFNILEGILIGLSISIFYILKTNGQSRLDIIKEIYPTGSTNRIALPQQMTFLNKASFIAELNAIPKESQLIIDARYSQFIDKEIIEVIKEFQVEAPVRRIALNLIGFKDQYNIHDHVNFITVTTYDVQSTLSPVNVLNILKEGNQRFLQDSRIHRSPKIDIKMTSETQHPIAVVLGCIDSRVPVETIFDMTFGDLFCVRVAGNVVNNDVLASIEYACNVVGAKLIVVLGHTRCGAIQSACDGIKKGHITELLAKIKPSLKAEYITESDRNGSNQQFVSRVSSLNVANTLQQIYELSTILHKMINADEIGIVGAMYHVETGEVVFSDYIHEISTLNHENTPLILKMEKVFSS